MTLGVCSHLLFLSMPSQPHLTFIESGFSSDLIDYVSVTTRSMLYCKTQPSSQQWHPSLLILLDCIWLQEGGWRKLPWPACIYSSPYGQVLFAEACVSLCVYALISAQIQVDGCVRVSALAGLSLYRVYISLHASLERFLAPFVMYQPEMTVWPSWQDRQDA